MLKKVRVVTVDNYQGEENDIIVLSLVRSNLESKIGFLKITNRVCVSLSRAKHGLYIFGDSECLIGSQLKLWVDVIDHLKQTSQIGDALQLACSNHDVLAEVRSAEDFGRVPDGGCMAPCKAFLPCLHQCTKNCHPVDVTDFDPTGHADALKKCG